jgi:hypothetical protein
MLVGLFGGWLGWLAGWLVGWLVSWLVGWLVAVQADWASSKDGESMPADDGPAASSEHGSAVYLRSDQLFQPDVDDWGEEAIEYVERLLAADLVISLPSLVANNVQLYSPDADGQQQAALMQEGQQPQQQDEQQEEQQEEEEEVFNFSFGFFM